ncbi:hypothetical protein G4H71_13195 [Rhodococcus triatomae]|uniref:Membrane protein n=1 Tax=Rhodococcus triatomae TaxID=300028 RepID=A0A1G8H1M7_9NOCA|nr:hypothetical protein [Rhodococcus triatomae]QNG20233.1 hypothetical protein G4H72_17185 [Rhodococcus triatomae]QNG23852.1 hypothetical protein G4H71_13195 [Rhodococcus triatomae]SDI00572.1 membrane protein [Rhodococcus triatomae]
MAPSTERDRREQGYPALLRAVFRGRPAGRTVTRVLVGLARIEWVDRSMTLAAQLFTSVLPVIIAGSVFMDSTIAGRSLLTQLGFDPSTVMPPGEFESTSSAAAFGVVGLLMVVVSGTSFARALARTYGRVWTVPVIGLAQSWRWFSVLFAVIASSVLVGVIQLSASGGLVVAGQWIVWACVWTLCPYLLTLGAVSGRVLVWTGAVTATLMTAIHTVGRVLLPHATAEAQAHFGTLGIVFTVIGWLFVLSLALVAAPVVVAALPVGEGTEPAGDTSADPPSSTGFRDEQA